MPDLPLPPIEDVAPLLLPAGAALAAVLAAAWLGRLGRARAAAVLWIVAIAGSHAWAFSQLRTPPVPPVQSTDRALFAILASGVLALLPALSKLAFDRRYGIAIVAAFVSVLATVKGIHTPAIAAWPLALVVFGAIAFFLFLDRAALRPTPAFCVSIAVAAGAAAEVLLLYRGGLLAVLAGALALTMLLIAAAAGFLKLAMPPAAAIPLAAILVTIFVDAAVFMHAPPPRVALLLFALAPLAPLVVEERRGARAGLPGLALSVACTAFGFFVAWRAAPH